MIKQLFNKWGLTILIGMLSTAAFAQTITGTVLSADDGAPIAGANVRVQGGSTATVTNDQGKFSINASIGDILVVSYLGFLEQEITVNAASVMTIRLQSSIADLDEVVVVGYGVQKKKLVTGANLQVKGDDLLGQSQTNALQALQGQAPGVQITTVSGQPGSGLNVIVRGLGTIGNAGPLYIVDGVQTGSISYLNPADIESIDILKDAASAAIYGSQSANGVVLITTRSGKAGRAQLTFDGYTGTQQVAKKARMLNASEYAAIMNEARINSGNPPYFSNDELAAMGEGTNWLNEMFEDNALTQNYTLGATGGTEQSVYSSSIAYTSQEGIVGGKGSSFYERYNFRLNSEHKLYKDIIKFGQHLTYTYANNNGIGVGNQYNNTLRGAFNTSPFVPMYDEEGNFFDNSSSDWNNGEANPYAEMVINNQNTNNDQKLIGDVYLSVQPIPRLTFKTMLGLDYYANEGRSFSPIYRLSIYAFNDFTSVNQSMGKGRAIMWDNTLTYDFSPAPEHQFTAMVGSSSYKLDGSGIWGNNRDLIFSGLKYAWLDNATNTDGANMSLGGAPVEPERRMSYFGRLNYNFRETYLLNATFRADGSSKFAPGHQWGYFPSVSAGWIATNESFMEATSGWLDFLKLRASWGQVGNQNISGFQFLAPVSFGINYIFGPEEGVLTPGAYPSRLGNELIKWETSEQTNIGLDARLMRNRLDVNVDWYIKDTRDWLIQAPILATAGAAAPFINGGDVRNKGVELALSFHDRVGDLNYSIGVNGAYNTNKVGRIPTGDGIVHGNTNSLYANSLEFYRAQDGFPIGYFWGLKTDGIFQSEDEVLAHRNPNGQLVQPSAQPGDVRYIDLNDDGVINDLDRTMVGDPNPNYTFGINIALEYKGFDFALLASGVAGNQLVQSWRNHSSPQANYSAAILDRWHGPGSSNSMPRVTEDARNWTQFSDLYIHDGDYLRINNITVGYDFGKVFNKSYLSKVRLYASVLNLYTFTRYNGMDPEIGYGEGFSSGVDLGYYPRPRTFMLGANIRF
ncbi:SusC/RagA family TonB-linked outer membrane protein [Parapedobacter tibetensis]|uniref:SusC/RagA family TonB-linked outer membrane protein n=1 Tax=Parapedobacter tibetensis TaxID=2972951 RepID=UPI00214D968C|nr:TonB-dependent receptor [Parapedobacter tibetensis]